MSNLFGTNQAPRVTAQYLNAVNDPAPGVPLASPSGSIVQDYLGQLGALLTLDDEMAAKLSDSTVGTLYAGVYQYVKFLAGTTAAPTRGYMCAWSDFENFVVTMDITDVLSGKLAGVCLNSVTKGQYGWIQVAGKATVLCKASSITKATPADGDLLILTSATTNTVDVLADNTNLTSLQLKRSVGVALQAPVAGAVKLAWLKHIALNIGQ